MTTTNDHQKLWDLIKDTRFGMFTHRHHDGLLHSHPLTTQNKALDEGATLYFFVPKDGEIARNVAENLERLKVVAAKGSGCFFVARKASRSAGRHLPLSRGGTRLGIEMVGSMLDRLYP